MSDALGARMAAVHRAYAAYAAAAAARREAARQLAAERICVAGLRMRRNSIRTLDRKVRPFHLQVGDTVRVSFLTLSAVRQEVKSQLTGDPLPLWSTDLYVVARVHERHGRQLYTVRCTTCGEAGEPRPAIINDSVAQLPRLLQHVERRHLLYVGEHVHASFGRAHEGLVPFTAADVEAAQRRAGVR
jgi:hypothetical protein